MTEGSWFLLVRVFPTHAGFRGAPRIPVTVGKSRGQLSSRTESVSKMEEPPGGAAGGAPGESVDARSSCDQPAQDQTKMVTLPMS